MAAMSEYCHPFTAVLVNTEAVNGLSRQLDCKAVMTEGLHTTQQTYTGN